MEQINHQNAQNSQMTMKITLVKSNQQYKINLNQVWRKILNNRKIKK